MQGIKSQKLEPPEAATTVSDIWKSLAEIQQYWYALEGCTICYTCG